MGDQMTGGVIAVVAIVGFVVYLLPAAIAGERRHQNAGLVLFVNLLIGWTLVGWLLCLVWAASGQRGVDPRQMRDCPFCAEQIKRSAKVCRHCGRDVVATAPG